MTHNIFSDFVQLVDVESCLYAITYHLYVRTNNKVYNDNNSNERKFVQYKISCLHNSMSNNKYLCFYEYTKNNLLNGTDGVGLNLFDSKNGTFTHFKHKGPNSICG